jgi:hypothetical protein
MSFIKLEKRVGVADARLGASMSTRIYKGSPKPMAFVALRRQFLDRAKFGKTLRFDVSVGDGDDTGKIRIVPNAAGVFTARALKAGSIILDLGHLPQLGLEEHRNHPAAVELVDGAAIVTVPDWTDEDDEDEEDDEEEAEEAPTEPPQRVEPRAPAPVTNGGGAPRAPASPTKGAPKAVIVNGITINLTDGCEAISYRGETVEVSMRGARLVEALAHAMPHCVGDDFLIGKLWDRKPPGASTSLDMVVSDLAALKKCRLEVRTQRGVGRQLVEVGK